MKRAVEFRTEARRLRHAFGRLTEPSLNRAMSSATPAVQRNINHCRSMLAKGIDDRANRQLVETLLRYMETSVAGAGRSASNHEHDALQASVTADEKRLKIVARELLRGQGLRTISYLRELADIANNAGDQSSAEAWQETPMRRNGLSRFCPGRVRRDRNASVEALRKRASYSRAQSWWTAASCAAH